MELNNKFDIKSEPISKLYRQMVEGELVYDPYYQRNFVWKEEHQVEFIKTILLGYPCPEVFIAEGDVDLESLKTYVHVIDGQQRLRTIEKFFSNDLEVDGKLYKDFSIEDRQNIFKYEIGVVILKLNPQQDTQELQEIFRRLNLKSYDLSETEKQISRFADNELVLLARLFTNDLKLTDGLEDEDMDEEDVQTPAEKFRNNPFITDDFKRWALNKDFSLLNKYFTGIGIFTDQNKKENTNTKDCMDMIGIFLERRFHSRVLNDDEILELTPNVIENKSLIYNVFSKVAEIFISIDFPEVEGFKKKKFLLTRSNAFSLFLALVFNYNKLDEISMESLQNGINDFCRDIPTEYKLAARNSNMDKKQREKRHELLNKVILKSI